MHACFYFVKIKFNFWLYFILNVYAKVTEQMNYSFHIIPLFVNPYFQSENVFSFFFVLCASLIAQRVDITVVFLTSVGVVAGLGFLRWHGQLIKNRFISRRC